MNRDSDNKTTNAKTMKHKRQERNKGQMYTFRTTDFSKQTGEKRKMLNNHLNNGLYLT